MTICRLLRVSSGFPFLLFLWRVTSNDPALEAASIANAMHDASRCDMKARKSLPRDADGLPSVTERGLVQCIGEGGWMPSLAQYLTVRISGSERRCSSSVHRTPAVSRVAAAIQMSFVGIGLPIAWTYPKTFA